MGKSGYIVVCDFTNSVGGGQRSLNEALLRANNIDVVFLRGRAGILRWFKINKIRVDKVYCNTFGSFYLIALYSIILKLDLPIIIRLRLAWPYVRFKGLFRWVINNYDNLYFIANSSYVAETFEFSSNQKVRVSINNIRIPNKSFRKIGFSFRGESIKNFDELLMTLSDISEAFEIHVAGVMYGDLNPHTRKKIEFLKGTHSFVFHGMKLNMKDFYETIEVYVLLTDHEAYSRSLVEAASFGVGVICKKTGGNPEIISLEHSGFIDEKNSLRSLLLSKNFPHKVMIEHFKHLDALNLKEFDLW
jgi:glycosyltransferase involved in cell wall biosynthesis